MQSPAANDQSRMTNPQGPPSFAIVRTDDSDVDLAAVARLMAEPLELSVSDLMQVLPQRSGILAEDLMQHVADRCVAILGPGGLAVRAVPQSAVIEPPEAVTLRSGRADEEVFFYVASDRKGAVKWPEVIWVDFVAVQEPSMEEFQDWDFNAQNGGTVRRFQTRRFVTTQRLFADLVTYDPWLLLRIPLERFEFAATGLPMFPNRRQNLTAFAATIASRAKAARLGRGMQWLESRSPPRENRMPSQAVYHGYLRWQLTRLFLK